MAEPAIRTSGLGHAYRRGAWLFRGLDLEVPAGSSLAILAPNGRGKSTLLKLLAGSLTPSEGEIIRSSQLAIVPSGLTIEFDYTAFDIVLMGRGRQIALLSPPSRSDEQLACAALARFGLERFASRAFNSLSSGERQLVLLARAIVSGAGTILLDEPTASLDLHNQQVVARWMTRLSAEGVTIVYTTHDPNHGMLADQALLLFGGEDLSHGAAASVINEPALKRLFGCEVLRAAADGANGSKQNYFIAALR